MSKVFEFNEHTVCMNPEVIYPPNAIKKDYGNNSIVVCCDEKGNWDYGFNMVGGKSMGSASPAARNGKFKSRDEAVEAAITYVLKNANIALSKETDCNNTEEFKKMAKEFIHWSESRHQLTLF